MLDFLRANKSKAFTKPEILNALYPNVPTSNWTEIAQGLLLVLGVDNTLAKLVQENSVKTKRVGSEIYYKAA